MSTGNRVGLGLDTWKRVLDQGPTGQANSNVLIGRTGRFRVYGQDTSLYSDVPFVANAATFNVTGFDADLKQVLNAEAGNFSVSGSDLTQSISKPLGSGSFNVTGYDSDLTYINNVEAATFNVSGFDLTQTITQSFEAGNFSITGQEWDWGIVQSLDSGSFNVTGYDSGLSYIQNFEAGSFTLTGFDANTTTSLNTGSGQFDENAFDDGFVIGANQALTALSSTNSTFYWTGYGIGTSIYDIANPSLSAERGIFTLTGYNANLQFVQSVTDATYNVTGFDIGTSISQSLDSGSFNVTGYPIATTITQSLDAGTFNITGYSANIAQRFDAGSFSVSGFDMTPSYTLPLADATFNVNGADAGLVYQQNFEAGSFTLTGFDAFLNDELQEIGSFASLEYSSAFDRTDRVELPANAATYTLTGFDATFNVAGSGTTRRSLVSPAEGLGSGYTGGGLEMTNTNTGKSGTWTLMFWYKNNISFNYDTVFAGATGAEQVYTWTTGASKLVARCYNNDVASPADNTITANTWHHVCIHWGIDFSGSTDVEIYIDGTSLASNPNGNEIRDLDQDTATYYLLQDDGADADMDGRVFDVIMIEGSIVAPANGNFTTAGGGQWQDYSGSYGTNGFRIDGQNVSSVGEDSSGNGHDFTQSAGGGSVSLDVSDIPPGANP